MTVRHLYLHSPFGRYAIAADEDAIVGVWRAAQQYFPAAARLGDQTPDDELLGEAAAQLSAWFAGERTDFDLPLAPVGTPFQQEVWEALRAIPYGETTTYGSLAASLGKERASQAVGSAVGRNPISVIVPCHRVIAADGGLTGYAGGLDTKEALLRHEATVLAKR